MFDRRTQRHLACHLGANRGNRLGVNSGRDECRETNKANASADRSRCTLRSMSADGARRKSAASTTGVITRPCCMRSRRSNASENKMRSVNALLEVLTFAVKFKVGEFGRPP